MKSLFFSCFLLFVTAHCAIGQGYFTITNYNVDITVNKDASLDVEKL
ncbi:MAG: hypothetical protein ABJA71_14665 [Ginsengibacter sp.]